MLSLVIGGVPAQTLGYGVVGDLEVAHLWSSTGGGLHYVKFSLALPRNYWHPVLTQGTPVEVLRGPVRLGRAILAEPDREEWTFVADGLFRRAEWFNAEDDEGQATTNVREAVVEANARGMGWTGFGNLPNVSVSAAAESSQSLNTVAEVLNAYCANQNLRWGVDELGVPYVASDPTTATWALSPGTPDVPRSDDDYFSRVVVRYVSAVNAAVPPEPSEWELVTASSAVAPHGPRETMVDITDQGLLLESAAQSYADAFISANGARSTPVAGIEVGPSELTTLGMAPHSGWMAGLLVCGKRGVQYGGLNNDGALNWGGTREWVAGSTVYRPGDGSLVVAPTDLAARTVAQVTFDLATRRARRKAGIVDE